MRIKAFCGYLPDISEGKCINASAKVSVSRHKTNRFISSLGKSYTLSLGVTQNRPVGVT